MALGRDMKANPLVIIRAHHASYVSAQTDRPRVWDYLQLDVLPAIIGIACGLANVQVNATVGGSILTVAALLSAFLFGVMLQISQRALDYADSNPYPGPRTSEHAAFLEEISANSAYAALVCIMTSIAFVVIVSTSGLLQRCVVGLGIALGVHMIFILLMVMKRVFLLTQARLTAARTGADLPGRRHAG